ncbi:hypothetical protein Q4555_05760 [Octadecabacter sp. 1_MG-2023]|uniref:hypothetical protein n=1 Tax=unclassified Octadecabacter TaxID=196158 RepID=UPI001C088A18|nr:MULTISPECIES: hypothetical protein [unclassified Octadecabacter]MBU2994543.1 hypothetical protein [Octadecabacter sp. B2R22]MDO6734164.1 hypothetical protein [Octadecabacter sp. 1_MG-2023]
MNTLKLALVIGAVGSLSACVEGTRQYQGPNDYIAVAADLGRDKDDHLSDNAGIAVTPDGCQAWLIDDGIDGRASNRLDPVTGLPVCAGEPGVVYGNYQSNSAGIRDDVPGDPVAVRVENVEVRAYDGQYQTVHSADAHTH